MDPIDGRALQLHQATGHGFICQKHEFFDQLVRVIVFQPFDALHRAAIVKSNLRLGKIEIE